MIKILLLANEGRENYVRAVEECGAAAVAKYIPDTNADYTVEYDGLILCGGNDVNPVYYGEGMNGSVDIDKARDEAEIAVAKQFLRAEKPIFGICRGMQLMNVLLGGTLIQHLPNVDEHRLNEREETFHEVIAKKGSAFARFYGERFTINSFHHQAIGRLGVGFEGVLTSLDGKVIEGIEHTEKPYFGVQWHPEKMRLPMDVEGIADGNECFRYFVELCRRNRDDR